MPAGTDDAERRALQRKAYARGGGLTPEEARRLRELDAAHLGPRAAAVAVPAEAGPPSLSGEPLAAEGSDAEAAAHPPEADPAEDPSDAVSAAHGAPAPAPPGRIRRRRTAALVAGGAALVAVGVGLGWALFSPRPAGPVLSAEQLERRGELAASGDYDPDSVRAIAQEDGALVWTATSDEGATTCLVLDVGERTQTSCVPTAAVEEGLSVAMPLPDEPAGESGVVRAAQVYATLLETPDGTPVADVRRWSMSSSLLAPFEGEERERAQALLDHGYDLGLAIAGYFRDAPVWIADRYSEEGVTQKCLVVDAGGIVQCAPIDEALRSGLGAQIVDDVSGGVATVSVLEARFTAWRSPYLTVTAAALPEHAGTGESFVVQGGPPGDPIVIRIPDDDPDG